MERFVQVLAAGGVVLVAGLWAVTLLAVGSWPWLLGAAAVVLGSVGLVAGVGMELELSNVRG